jgi:hypothetical protein
MDLRDYGADSGSVRRARERVGAGLSYVQLEHSDDQKPKRNAVLSTTDTLHRSTSQASSQWPLESHQQTVQDILQHPLMAKAGSQPSQAQPQPRPQSNGELLASFKFPELPPPQPQPPPPAVVPSRRGRDPIPPPSARRPGSAYQFNNPAPFVSPIVEEGSDSSPRSRSVYSRASSEVLANYSTPNLAAIDQSEYEGSSLASTPRRPSHDHHIIRQASLGKKAKPAITTIRITAPSEHPKNNSNATPDLKSRQAAINALSVAVANSMGNHYGPAQSPAGSRSHTPGGTLRMPFADNSNSPPLSPRSMDTTMAAELEPPRTFDVPGYSSGSRSPLLNPDTRGQFHLKLPPARPGLSEKIPSSRRPPPLDIETPPGQRSSTTSLSELIKRATKLAANLDRGKTASRLGMLDMLHGDGEKPKRRDPNEKRESGISDMLGAFPGTPGGGPYREKGEWPEEGVKMNRLPSRLGLSSRDESKKRGRRCCGMSLTMFILVMIVLVVLVTAAVLVPVFLIVLPAMRQNKSVVDLASCRREWSCENGGVQAVVAGNCGCVCVGGWTGNHCMTPPGPDCVTATVGGIQNATMGQSILDIFQEAEKNFSIPLDTTSILGMFSLNNLACTGENTLVAFNQPREVRRDVTEKRIYPIQDLELDALDQELFIPDGTETGGPQPTAKPTRLIAERNPAASAVGTSNGIVFQAPTTTADIHTTAAAVPASATAPSSSSTPTASSVSQKSLNFARVVVLYVLEQSATVSVAANARSVLQNYLLQGGSESVEVGFAGLDLWADFTSGRFQILWGNGTVVGQ